MIYQNFAHLITAPVNVPANFLGLRSTKRSNGNVSAGQPFKYSAISNLGYNRYTDANVWDFGELLVKTINPSSGVFYWDVFDRLLGQNPGKDLFFLLGFPADYLVAGNTPAGSCPFGGLANYCPTGASLTTYASVCAAIAARAKNNFGITGAKWCLWGEVDTAADYYEQNPAGWDKLATSAKAVNQAIKAVDPTAVIVAPSTSTGAPYIMNDFLTASDGAGGTGRDWVSAIAFDPYQDGLTTSYVDGISRGNFRDGLKEAKSKVDRVLGFVPTAVGMPIYIPETGIKSHSPNGSRDWTRRIIGFAALGVKQLHGFATDETNEGYDMRPFIDGWNKAYDILQGGGVTINSLVYERELDYNEWNGVARAYVTVNGTQYEI